MAKKNKTGKPTPEELGRMLQNIYESGYMDRNTFYKMSFLKGIVTGLGGVIGATIVVALLLWVLNLFDHVPLLGPLTDKLQNTVDVKKP
jgi:uncharacterized membrane protein YfcA